MAKAENQAPGKDPIEAVMPWEAEYVEKTKGEMVVPFHIDNVTAEVSTPHSLPTPSAVKHAKPVANLPC